MPFLPEMPNLPQEMSETATIVIIQNGEEFRATPQQLTDLLKESFGFASTEASTSTEPKRTTISSGLSAFTPSINYETGYTSYYTRLTSNLVVALPVVDTTKLDADLTITIDTRQDGTGQRNITFTNVTDWYNIDPYDTANPAVLQVNKAANAFGTFTFRNIQGFWFGNYSRPV